MRLRYCVGYQIKPTISGTHSIQSAFLPAMYYRYTLDGSFVVSFAPAGRTNPTVTHSTSSPP